MAQRTTFSTSPNSKHMYTEAILNRIKHANIVNDDRNIKIISRENSTGAYNSIEISFLFPKGSIFKKMTLQFVSYINIIKLIMLFNDIYYDEMSIVDADYENLSSFIEDNNLKTCIEALKLTSENVYLQDFKHNNYDHTNLVLEFKNPVAHLQDLLNGGKKIADAMHAKYELAPIDVFGFSATHGNASVKPSVAQTLSTLSGSPPPKAASTANGISPKKFACVVTSASTKPATSVWNTPASAPAPAQVEQAPAPAPTPAQVEQAPAPISVEQAPALTPDQVEKAPAPTQVEQAPAPTLVEQAPKKKKTLRPLPSNDESDKPVAPAPAPTQVEPTPAPNHTSVEPVPAPAPVQASATALAPVPPSAPITLSITERMEAILQHIHAEMRAIGTTVAEQKRKLDQDAEATLAPLRAHYEKVANDLKKLKKIAEEQEVRKREQEIRDHEQAELMASYANYPM